MIRRVLQALYTATMGLAATLAIFAPMAAISAVYHEAGWGWIGGCAAVSAIAWVVALILPDIAGRYGYD